MRLPFVRCSLCWSVALVLACGPAPPARPVKPPPMANTCSVRLGPRDADAGAPALADSSAAPPVIPASMLVVGVDVPLASVTQALEPRVPRRVAEEHDRDIGIAGRLEYVVDRGPFTAHVDGDTLVVETPLTAQAQAFAKGRSYASCTPTATAKIRVPLKLSADYKLHTSDVHIEITRGCQIRALGGLLSLDVTPMVSGALDAQSKTMAEQLDHQLPDLRGEATKLWQELEKPVSLPFGECLVLDPQELVQGPASGSADVAHLHFALGAHPELHVKCKDMATAAPAPRELPPLRHDPALPDAGDVHLAMVLPPDAPARALGGGEPFDLGVGRARIESASGDARALAVTLSGEICGDAMASATGVAWTKRTALHLTGARISPGDVGRLTKARVDPAMLASAIEAAEIPLPIAIDGLGDLLQTLASNLKDDRVAVAAAVSAARPESASLRDGATPVAMAYLHGAVTLTLREMR